VVVDREADDGIAAHLESSGEQEQEWNRNTLQNLEHDGSIDNRSLGTKMGTNTLARQ